MATFELTEFAEAPSKFGNVLPVAKAPWIRHSVVTIGAGNEFQLHADTRYVTLGRASATFRYKFGRQLTDVSGGNAPTATTARDLQATDAPQDYQVDGASWLGTV